MNEPRPRRSRGVRLSDLDRSKVYRIGYSGRRWEVLGADPDPTEAGAGRVGPDAGRPEAARQGPPAPHASPDENGTERA